MYKSLKSFGERFKYLPVIKRKLTDQSKQKNVSPDRVFAIQTVEEFNQKLTASDSPVVINFSAVWCLNCNVLTPMIESIVRENSRELLLLKVDVDKHTDLALEYNVSVIPVLFGVNRGKIQSTLTGLHDVEKVQSWVGDFLKST